MGHQLWCPKKRDVIYKVTVEISYSNLGQQDTQSRSWNLWSAVFPLGFPEQAVVSEILNLIWFVKYTVLLMDCSVCLWHFYTLHVRSFREQDMYFSSRWIVCDQAIGNNIPFARNHFKVLCTFVGTLEAQIHVHSQKPPCSGELY